MTSFMPRENHGLPTQLFFLKTMNNRPARIYETEDLLGLALYVQVLALASLAQVLVCSTRSLCTDKNEKCDLYVICMEQYSIFCH